MCKFTVQYMAELKIARKMASGQLLFSALHGIVCVYSEFIVGTL